VTPFVTAGSGFLLAVLWFDLMFDVQARGRGGADLSEEVLGSISAYYRRVTTTARPMNRLIATVMLGTTVAIAIQIATGDAPRAVGWVSLALAASAILLAAVRTVPNAQRLGTGNDAITVRSRLARAVLRDHLFCLSAIASVIAIQLIFAA
jgi:hypothetical protein